MKRPHGPGRTDGPREKQIAKHVVTLSNAPHPEFNLYNPLNYMPPELRALSEQHLTGSGETVLGPFKNPSGGPSYIELAQQRGASYFDIGDAWNASTPVERLAANQHVLEVVPREVV
ncbi:hypothetical protein [Mycobacterium avium]|uniref:hypothetical protein n=1 Tax=Mycobacterium avium TaxID=1764 RepID=UPI001D13891B|nr:hypothetical protein [Mycobacterium avium]MDV3265905.1 hypothetical protein [Mycobacterium avium]UEA19683.1 hypothetical protein LK460_21585 [Mycobacterium avium subsp. avium]UEA33569.1 hypothetical protein LK466_18175 [Mycobacterium avium subsp. avium]UGU11900.1 hypothetical protein LTQ57_00620 [Mycobacterium avium subsp. avium]UGU21374.1 hypothetical protein LT348_05875 [Mycobacterium avium subsp. avium]